MLEEPALMVKIWDIYDKHRYARRSYGGGIE
jgi:hypothetical protein